MGHNRLTRVLAALLALTLLGTMAVSAASFSDLEKHWAKDYMMDLYDQGYLKGFTDNEMKPDITIPGSQTLALLSRLFDVDESTLALAKEDYGAVAEQLIPSAQAWLNQENAIVLCLAGGVIGETELKNLISAGGLTAPLTREYLCVLFARAMGLEDKAKALEKTTMTFDDLSTISADCLPYVQVIYDAGIVEGNTHNEFLPKKGVTRAVVATMFSRALTYLEKHDGLPTLDGYSDTIRVNGIVTAASSRSVSLRAFDGICYTMPIAADAAVTAGGNSLSNMTSTYVGRRATVDYNRDSKSAVKLTISMDGTWVQGSVKTSDNQTITLDDAQTGKAVSYNYNEQTKFYYADKAIEKSSLAKNYFVTASMTKDTMTAVYANPGNYVWKGTLAEIDYGTTCTLTLTDKRDMQFTVSFDIANLPTFLRGGIVYPDGLSRLTVGDELEITVENNVLKEIATDDTAETVSGTISAIIQTAKGYSITVKPENGTSATYTVSDYVTVTRNGAATKLSALKIGDGVELVVAGSDVTSIKIVDTVAEAASFTGKVLYVDTTKRQIMLEQNGLLYVNTKSATIVNSTGGTETLKSIEAGDTILVYGTMSGSSEIAATLITVLK